MLKKRLSTRNERVSPGSPSARSCARRAQVAHQRARLADERADVARAAAAPPRAANGRVRSLASRSAADAGRMRVGSARARRPAPRRCASVARRLLAARSAARARSPMTFVALGRDRAEHAARTLPTSSARSSSLRAELAVDAVQRVDEPAQLGAALGRPRASPRARSRYVGSKRRSTSRRSSPRPSRPSPAPLSSSLQVVARVGVQRGEELVGVDVRQRVGDRDRRSPRLATGALFVPGLSSRNMSFRPGLAAAAARSRRARTRSRYSSSSRIVTIARPSSQLGASRCRRSRTPGDADRLALARRDRLRGRERGLQARTASLPRTGSAALLGRGCRCASRTPRRRRVTEAFTTAET